MITEGPRLRCILGLGKNCVTLNEELENVSSKPAKCTLLIDEIISAKNVLAWVSMNFIQDKFSAPRTIEKMKILGANFGATS